LRSISRKMSKAIFEDALVAYRNVEHPCHQFVGLQHGVAPDRWQLPVPFMGHSAGRGVVFLGLNPSWNELEPSPRWGVEFDEFDRFWREAFDSIEPAWPSLYRWYQRIGERALGDDFSLGRDGLVLEVIRYRSAQSAGCRDPAVLAHELPTTRALLEEATPRAILCCGGDSFWYLREMLPDLARQPRSDLAITKIQGMVFSCDTPWGRIGVVASAHITSARGLTSDDRLALGDRLREVLTSAA
jgi:hypothetical protein